MTAPSTRAAGRKTFRVNPETQPRATTVRDPTRSRQRQGGVVFTMSARVVVRHNRRLLITRPMEGGLPGMPPSPRLVVTDPRGRRQVPVDKSILTLGRRSESDIQVTGVGVSRHHAEIAAGTGGFLLRDLDSKFGTYVNGKRTGECVLAHGDQIRLGESHDTKSAFLL